MKMTLRRATASDLAAVNARYAEVDFVPSQANELIVLATYEGQTVGQGRVVPVNAECGELGGIYVFAGFEGRGIARQVVDFLLQNAPHARLYCLPFAELRAFYGSMGFGPVSSMDSVPPSIIDKYQWCQHHYPKNVLLLERRR